VKRYTLEEITSEDVDCPPKTFAKARRKFGQATEKAYAWFFGDEALQKQKDKRIA
jgi:hypothetical protein